LSDNSPYLDFPARALVEYRDELVARMQALPLTDRRRAWLADAIRQVEAAIDRMPLGEDAMREMTIPTVLVGTSFKGAAAIEAIAKMVAGSAVRLTREPENRHDAFAVACHYLGAHVGYIPKRTNPRIAQALDCGVPVHCTVSEPGLVRGHRVVTEPKLTVTWRQP
jgi:predicted dienelactone hydrolase